MNEHDLPPVWGETPGTPPRRLLPAGKREMLFGLAMVVAGLGLANCLFMTGASLGFALMLLFSLGAAAVYLARGGCRGDGYSRALLVLSAVIAAGLPRGADGFVKFVMVCFLFVGINLGLTGLAGKLAHSTAGASSLLDAFRTAFGLGFGKLPESLGGVREAFRSGGPAAKKSGAVLVGLAMAVPVLAIMIPLLMRSDAAFEGLLELLPEIEVPEIFVTLLFGIPLLLVLYTRTVALAHAGQTAPRVSRGKKLSSLTMNTLLGAVCVLYAVYLVSQLAYFSGGFSGILPKGYSLSEYARRGFFEMAWLCAINLSVMILGIGLGEKLGGKTSLATRLLCLFIGMVTLFLVAAAGAKMVLYIGSYGMTRLRILTMVIMAFLGLTTVIVCVWLFMPKLAYMRIVVLSALVIGAAVLWTDVNSLVAAYNVDAYLSGRLETVDVLYLEELGGAAAPQLRRLWEQAQDTKVTRQAAGALSKLCGETWVEDFRDWNYTDYMAGKITAEWKNTKR